MKKNYLIFVLGCLLILSVSPFITHAQVVINEVMYDVSGTDTGREWIEVYNQGTESIDLSTWKLFEAEVNHRLTPRGDSSLPVGGYAVLVDNSDKFLTDYPSFNGLVFDSTFSLSNTGEILVLRDKDAVDVDTLSYDVSLGAGGDGNSLQKNGSSFIAGTPTPGTINTTVASIPQTDTGSGGNGTGSATTTATSTLSSDADSTTGGAASVVWSSHSSQSVAYTGNDEVELGISAGRDRLTSVGSKISFEGKVRTPKSISSSNVSYTWSFGDGTSGSGQFIDHIYLFPGEYTVIVNGSHKASHAVAKVLVRVAEASLGITNNTEEFIELTNKAKNEINVGGWILEAGNKNFIIPQDTIINSKQSIKIPRGATHLAFLETKIFDTSKRFVAGNSTLAYADPTTNTSLVVTSVSPDTMQITGVTKAEFEEKLAMVLKTDVRPSDAVESSVSDIPNTFALNSETAQKSEVKQVVVKDTDIKPSDPPRVAKATATSTKDTDTPIAVSENAKMQAANILFTVDSGTKDSEEDSGFFEFIKNLFKKK